MGPEEVRVGRGELGDDEQERREAHVRERREGVEHRVHERERLRLLREVERGQECDGRAEGR